LKVAIQDLIMIGDRINPGFRSTKDMLEAGDIAALQALAVRQVDSGANYLDLTIGPRGYEDAEFLTRFIQGLQAAVEVPLCFDYPSKAVQEVCLKAYDPAKAGGRKPLVNSVAETRWEIMDLLDIRPFQVIVMASEYLDDGVAKPTKHTQDMVRVAKRLGMKLMSEHGFEAGDIFIDVTINSLVSDTEGMTRMALQAIREIGKDPDLQGTHIMGGLTNVGNMLPPKEYDGVKLRQCMENAFLTVAIPLGFDAVMATPWNNFQILPEEHEVLTTFRDVIELNGLDAMRRLRQLWAPPRTGVGPA
jgi:cobalamin-dependent methionine synthase I